MRKKIIGIVIMLMLVVTVLPVTGTLNKIETQQVNSLLNDEWPMLLHDNENTGYTTSTSPNTNRVKWTYQTDFWTGGSPSIANGKIYFGSDDETFRCLDAENGSLIWSCFIDGGVSASSCTIFDGMVIQGSTYDYIYCWDAETGEEIWTYNKGYGISCSPVVVNGKVYTAKSRGQTGQNGFLFCLDVNTGSLTWKYDMGWNELSSPAVYNDKIYICSEDGYIYCFNIDTHTLLWKHGTAHHFSHPTIFDNRVFYSGGSKLKCLNAETGEAIWFADTDSVSSPCIAYNNVYSVGTTAYCLNMENGDIIWTYPIGGKAYSCSPVVADGKIYFGIWNTGYLLCLDAYTGELIWEYYIGGKNWLFSTPSIAYGKLYMLQGGSYPETSKLYCFEDYVEPNDSPFAPSINGTINGNAGVEYTYTFNSVDPDNDDVYYWIEWGDGYKEIWKGSYPSGIDVSFTHTYDREGTFTIKAKAKDTHDLESDWNTLTVTMPRNKNINNIKYWEIWLNSIGNIMKKLNGNI